MKVIFSHGKESGPWGSKIKRLATIAEHHDYEIQSIDYTDLSEPDERVTRLSVLLDQEPEPVILVGSSMGGYVSIISAMVHPAKVQGIFVLAPALYMPNYNVQHYSLGSSYRVELVHGWQDDVIPPAHAFRFAETNNCSLHLLAGDHRLNNALPQIEPIFSQFLVIAKHSTHKVLTNKTEKHDKACT